MSIVKVLEIISEGNTIEAAVSAAVVEVEKTVQNLREVYVDHITGIIDEKTKKVSKYRVNVKISFVVEHNLKVKKSK